MKIMVGIRPFDFIGHSFAFYFDDHSGVNVMAAGSSRMKNLQPIGRNLSSRLLLVPIFASIGLGFVGGALLAVPVGDAAAQTIPAPMLGMEQAVQQAVEWHPSVEEAMGRLDAQAEERHVAKAGYQPRITAGVGSDMLRGDGANRWRPRANINASQMIQDFGKVGSNVRLAEAGDRVYQARLLYAVDNLARETAQALVENQRAAMLRRVAEDQLSDLRMIEEMVNHRYQRGAATKSDALQAKGRVGGAEADIQRIDSEILRWRGTLANLLGGPVSAVDPDVPDWLMQICAGGVAAWESVPSIQEAQAERDRALAEFERSKADRLPTISLEAGASGDVHEPWSRRADYNIGIRVNSSVFSGGASTARARGASHALSAANAAENRIRLDIQRVFAELQEDIIGRQNVLETLKQRETDMRETGSLYRLQYLEMGTRSLVDLLNAQQELHQLRFTIVNTQHDIRRTQTECLFYSGASRDRFSLTGKRVRGVIL